MLLRSALLEIVSQSVFQQVSQAGLALEAIETLEAIEESHAESTALSEFSSKLLLRSFGRHDETV
jgi:hypothetical protein